jgi:hypothetical protein
MKFNKLFMIFLTIIFFSGIVFSAGTSPEPATLPAAPAIFDVDISLPNPYYGFIVSDASNLANPDSVKSESIRSNAIENRHLKENSVSTLNITDDSITSEKIASNSVRNINIYPYSVKNLQLGPNAITASKIMQDSIKNSHISNNAITADKIAFGAVTRDKIAYGAVSIDKLDILNNQYAPKDGSYLIYDQDSGKLKWTEVTSQFEDPSLSIGDISETTNNFDAPFNSCQKERIYSVISNVGTIPILHDATLKWVLNDIPSNISMLSSEVLTANTSASNQTKSITVNLSENNLYGSDSFDMIVSLYQPFSDDIENSSETYNKASKNNCKPFVNSLNVVDENYEDPLSMCVENYNITGHFNCLDSCSYELRVTVVDGGTVILDSGVTSDGPQVVSYDLPFNDVYYNYGDGSGDVFFNVSLEVENLGPNGLEGLTTIKPTYNYTAAEPNASCPV